LNFTHESNIKSNELIQIFENFELLIKISPPQIQYEILNSSKGIVKQSLFVKSIKKEINFESQYSKISNNSFSIQVISGPLKGTKTIIRILENHNKSEINVELNLKLGIQYKIFSSILSKKIKSVNISLFNRLEKFAKLLYNDKHKISFENNFNTLVLNQENKKLFFDGWWLGDVWSCFIGNVYDKFPIKNKTIIDIGLNIGDTSISFIHKGAKKVIGLEPFPINYEFAKSNTSKNNMEKQIVNILGGCGSKSSEILVDPNLSGLGYQMEEKNEGRNVKQFSLKELVNKFEIEDAVIKMNCEGCEYDTIINSPKNILEKFSYFIIQYHEGPDLLIEKLSSIGFEISTDFYSEKKGQLIAKNNFIKE